MRFLNDIYSIDNKKMANKGDKIDGNLGKNISKFKKEEGESEQVKNTFISEDIDLIFKDKHYQVIFQPEDICSEIANIVGESYLEKNIISELASLEKDFPYTYRHILDVTILAIRMVLYMDDDNYNPVVTSHVGLTHDIGKSRIPRDMLYKTDRLTIREWNFIQTHPAISYVLLLYYPINYKTECLNSSFNHHEKLDGTGYPRGISDITKYTKLVTPVDMLDALLNSRPYRDEAYTLRAALDCLQEEATQGKIDKRIVFYLISLFRKNKPNIKDLKVGKKWRDDPPENNFYGIRG